MKYQLDLERLSSLAGKKCGTKGLREVSNEIGISPSTLSRLLREQHVPDMETFTALCNWLDVPPSTFFRGAEISNPLSVPEAIALQLRSDKNLDPATANVLAILIKAAYRELEK
ncbi:helix-turn-helix domain-containing protein [Nostoc sp. TCL240-02]|uniref:helix-turn-helix domain-containing protein n=1 Tax=Nostoc sp. TCL240-02 TaxID=2572090 RepID=UPI00157FB335|nr:helix-turn-helix transcriptional regulator [Nostoc sp. TCL240-02]QKQ75657.1 helix-turn-helix transcriptional regulator [Nostoc sp. TCL240-02]